MRTKLSVFCDKIIEAGWLAVVVAVPLFFNIYTARTFEPDKITLLRSIVGIMALAWLISVAERGVIGDSSNLSLAGRFRSWRKTPLFLPTLVLVLVYIIATIFSISPRVSLWGSYQRLQGLYSTLSYIVLFALVAGNLRSRDQVDRLVTVIIIASIPVGLYGIVQRYGLDPLPWAGDVTRRVASNMGNAIFVASYLIMVIPLTLSRLIESMTAIIREEKASWGHTVLAAIYIFAAAVQMLTVVFSQSRGPMLGILGAAFVMGLLIVLILRRLHADPARLSLREAGAGIGFVAPLGLAAAVFGGAGYLVGLGLQGLLRAMSYQLDGLPLLGAILGGLLGFFGLYSYMAAAGKGWRWLWLSWLATAVIGMGFVLLLNVQGTALDPVLNSIREMPYVSRLSQVTGTESGTGRVRVLIWDAALELVAPHQPLGIPGDELAPPDRFNAIRPAIGYGPESMFNAFAFVYPPELAHVEQRGSSADRSHNETMDSLVMTGVIGFLAFYYVMVSVFYYALNWLGWTPDRASKRRLLALLIAGGIAGAVIPLAAQGRLTFAPLGLPFGVIAGSVLYLVWQGFVGQKRPEPAVAAAGGEQDLAETAPPTSLQLSAYHLLLIGLFGALVGHFIEVHFVFSIAATYTYFWLYAGLMLAMTRLEGPEPAVTPAAERTLAEEGAVEKDSEPVADTRRSRKARGRRAAAKRRTAGTAGQALPPRNWEARVGAQGLAMAIILIILVFDFVTPQFRFDISDKDSLSLLWMVVITWAMGLGIALSDLAIRQRQEAGRLPGAMLGRAGLLYGVTSLAYFFFYYIAHRLQLGQRITVASLDDVVRAAGVLSTALVVFYLFLLLLMVLLAVMLSWGQMAALPGWRSRNWWLYPPLALAVVAVIWFKNIDVVRADIFLKEGERYRSSRQWQEAIVLHQKARSLDSDEDFYYLMLALDYQLMAQDGQVDENTRRQAWQEGEEIALTARRINPYNPDNTGNMGRYYFTLGQVLDPARFQDALTYFEKATILAPSNVVYHNLWAQTLYVLQEYPAAVERLKISVELDSKYAPTWILLGDTYAAMGDMEQALEAHRQAMQLSNDFFDQYVDQRLNFYISAGLLEQAVAAMAEADRARAGAGPTPIPWAIAHAYNLAGQPDRAITYLERARAGGDTSDRVIRELARSYFNQNAHAKALEAYQALLQLNPNDVEAHSALAFIYAQQGRPAEAIQHNQMVLQQRPNDYDSLKNLAILYQQQGQWQEALQAAQQAQAVAPATETSNWEQFIIDLENQKNTPG